MQRQPASEKIHAGRVPPDRRAGFPSIRRAGLSEPKPRPAAPARYKTNRGSQTQTPRSSTPPQIKPPKVSQRPRTGDPRAQSPVAVVCSSFFIFSFMFSFLFDAAFDGHERPSHPPMGNPPHPNHPLPLRDARPSPSIRVRPADSLNSPSAFAESLGDDSSSVSIPRTIAFLPRRPPAARCCRLL